MQHLTASIWLVVVSVRGDYKDSHFLNSSINNSIAIVLEKKVLINPANTQMLRVAGWVVMDIGGFLKLGVAVLQFVDFLR